MLQFLFNQTNIEIPWTGEYLKLQAFSLVHQKFDLLSPIKNLDECKLQLVSSPHDQVQGC